ncbi:hypothetical protein MW722_001212 [Acinetobacter baumannii]|uniref:Uncharacterized protein n=2 Tax=Acinetobacter baumannii TaxID=470 RepID=A0AAD2U4K1_ACIBA|nr:hypothetical protein [Acinetobacter baumannii]EMT92096.1 hypothetical protein ABNIH5_05986 [Acinetobacter baumannii ABNIH5]EXV29765.1 putative membrane protein [Acinetobacter baumannii 24975_4]EYD08710.1 putative membrane protein [Acinetobacter baumannii 44362_1]KCW39220.1 putative membrane protein [Acinetobacter baumannii 1032359]EGT94064.1 hypothetical protein ABNIH1_06972 [Acinetobacter baumannii ABNIH1]
MKTFLIIMTVVCIATFLGLVMAALAAKLHQYSGSLAKFRFSLAFMDITFFFLCISALAVFDGGKYLAFAHLTQFLLSLYLIFYRSNKWERSQ